MTGKRKPTTKRDLNQSPAVGRPEEREANGVAKTVLRPTVQAAATLKAYGTAYGDLDLAGLIEALSAQTQATTEGDLSRAEAMLTAQAHTLDSIFNNLARLAINAEYVDNLDRYLKLALRAQSQCRATWEALSTIKNPPVMGYVRQANIAHGHQQVNNAPVGDGSRECARARENPNAPNKLLEQSDGERLDTGTTNTAGGADTPMEAVGAINRAKNRRR